LFNAFFLLALVPVSLVPKDIISISLAFLFESGFGLSNLPNLWIKSLLLLPVPLTIIPSCASGTSTPSSKTLDVTMALYLPSLNRSQLRAEGSVLTDATYTPTDVVAFYNVSDPNLTRGI
jgi:hypothetical protein